METYERTKGFSEGKVRLLRDNLSGIAPEELIILTFGSYARGEASDNSDLDYVQIYDNDVIPSDAGYRAEEIKKIIGSIISNAPSPTGAFGGNLTRADMFKNLGGNDDTNHKITCRILLLLEGEWLTSENRFNRFRRDLIDHYVSATPRDEQLALFLLNDIIRYWRTVTVDYAYKTSESGKPWAIRNIKLTFSRKLMYAGGLFSIATTYGKSAPDKADSLDYLFKMPVISRLEEICGKEKVGEVRSNYERFLEAMESRSIRDTLNSLSPGDRDNPIFRDLKNEGYGFTKNLMILFKERFEEDHPIHRALMF